MVEEINKVAEFLAKVPFFSEVAKNSLIHLCEHSSQLMVDKRDPIFKKGDEGDAMYVILGGKVVIHENGHQFGYLQTGDCFGEYALIDHQARSASVTAMQETHLLKIEREHFLDLMKMDQGFARGILFVMIKRHRELDITQEQLANSKKELELANNKMGGLINGAMDAIIMFNERFRIVLTNPSADSLLENEDTIQRNVLFFFDDATAKFLETMVNSNLDGEDGAINNYLPGKLKVIGSKGKETLNEGTISKYGQGNETFYTLILRNIEERLVAQDKIKLLTKKTEYLEEEIRELTNDHGLIAEDASMRQVLNLIDQVARTDATVLITGETGTGKELVARAIHGASQRSGKPLIRINCGAIPANLIESELFGHEKGAFTGATTSRKGRFLLADKGTIFLDEIAELPLELQPKLLRVIQEGEFDPVGSSETIKVDVRLIAATHRDLLENSKEGKFREDLYYRLNVFPITLPPLRDRGNDIALIAEEMLNRFSTKMGVAIRPLTPDDKTLISRYHWPGNVRELRNIIERAVIIANNGVISWETVIPRTSSEASRADLPAEARVFTSEEIANLERENIIRALRKTAWKISGKGGAAALLHLRPTTLTSKIKALGIVRPV